MRRAFVTRVLIQIQIHCTRKVWEPHKHAAGVCLHILYSPVGDHTSGTRLRKRLEVVTEALSVKHQANFT